MNRLFAVAVLISCVVPTSCYSGNLPGLGNSLFPPVEGNLHSPLWCAPDSVDTSAGQSPGDQQVDKGRLALVGGTLVLSMVTIHIYQQNGWWKDNRAPFHFQEDLVYGLNVDKFGHFYGATLMEFAVSKCLEWANVSEESALYFGSGGALLFQTYVEVEDGFSAWGFDRVDFASDLAGSLWPIARYHFPVLRNIDMKLSYHPSSLLGEPGGTGFKGQKHLMIDDYEGQTIWFSVKVGQLLPESFRKIWPEFLGVSLGYGVRNVAGVNPHRVYFLAPDLDVTKIIPPSTSFLKTLGQALNFIHLPLPAVQFLPGSVWYGLYF
ncbi:MAG TPA: hypothetical protein VLY03_01650 [Bacteroidota bacterium]|nr:hypothetical protein [Bacteroidota bacterium]